MAGDCLLAQPVEGLLWAEPIRITAGTKFGARAIIRVLKSMLLTQPKSAAVWNMAVTANEKGENIMQQVDTNQLISQTSTVFNRIIIFFGSPRISTAQPDQIISNIDWHDSNPESGQPSHDSCKRPVCGGYNEAFIVQYWASYNLH
jgi:hypothetical protein